MFLSAILCAALSWCPQEPQKWFTVSPADAEVPAGAVAHVDDYAASSLRQLRPLFPGLPKVPFRIFVHRDMASLDPEVAAALHPETPGVALLGRHSIHIVLANLRHVENEAMRPVVLHEVVHELLDQLAGPFSAKLPRWFHEGLAQTLAEDSCLGGREEDLIWRVGTNQLLPFSKLEDDFPREDARLHLAYAQSYSYVAYLARAHGAEDLIEAVREMDADTSFLAALVQVTQQTTWDLEEHWRDYLVHGSGARSRVLLDNFFYLLMILALPFLALAMIRRLRSDRRARDRLQRYEDLETERRQQMQMPRDAHDGEQS